MNETKKTKGKGKYKVYIEKSLSKNGDKINVTLRCNKKLQELLERYSVKEENGKTDKYGNPRWLIKSVLVSHSYWSTTLKTLFTKKFVRYGKIDLRFDSKSSLDCLIKNLRDFFDYILEDIIELQQNLTIEAEVV